MLQLRPISARSKDRVGPFSRSSRTLSIRAEAQAEERNQDKPLPTRLNATPHERETRQFFYELATEGMMNALNAGRKRLQLRVTIPELNTEQDVYRVGTLLEMTREM